MWLRDLNLWACALENNIELILFHVTAIARWRDRGRPGDGLGTIIVTITDTQELSTTQTAASYAENGRNDFLFLV